jgi:hypothetical protein
MPKQPNGTGEDDSMEEFFSPSTRLELLRFKNLEEWFSEVAEEAYGSETGPASARATHSPAAPSPQ